MKGQQPPASSSFLQNAKSPCAGSAGMAHNPGRPRLSLDLIGYSSCDTRRVVCMSGPVHLRSTYGSTVHLRAEAPVLSGTSRTGASEPRIRRLASWCNVRLTAQSRNQIDLVNAVLCISSIVVLFLVVTTIVQPWYRLFVIFLQASIVRPISLSPSRSPPPSL